MRRTRPLFALLFLSLCLVIGSAAWAAEEIRVPTFEEPKPSVDMTPRGYGLEVPEDIRGMATIQPEDPVGDLLSPAARRVIEAYNFDSSLPLTGNFLFIPPDPIGAAGPDHLVNVGNVLIQWFTKDGVQQNLQTLQSFFSTLNAVNFSFDPKVIYDQYADRFVVITLERRLIAAGDPVNSSRILIAVSKTSNPNDGWWYQSINSLLTIGTSTGFADYPGLAVDDNAIYITRQRV